MKKILFSIFVIAFTSTAIAQSLPSYYPSGGFQRTGRIDAVYGSEGRVVIDDVSYNVSSSAVVHSLSSNSDSLSRIRRGAHVAFKTGAGRVIKEFWLLPNNYEPRRNR